jgi:hypothetical protein
MLRDFVSTASAMHAERLRRLSKRSEPLDQPGRGLKVTIGHTLIHLGERLARAEHPRSLRRAA